jgi:hypothetical protein
MKKKDVIVGGTYRYVDSFNGEPRDNGLVSVVSIDDFGYVLVRVEDNDPTTRNLNVFTILPKNLHEVKELILARELFT